MKFTVFGSYGFRFHGFRFHGSDSVPIIINFFMCASEARDGGTGGGRDGGRGDGGRGLARTHEKIRSYDGPTSNPTKNPARNPTINPTINPSISPTTRFSPRFSVPNLLIFGSTVFGS